jgi:cytochrome c-type biogenesis protein CcmE
MARNRNKVRWIVGGVVIAAAVGLVAMLNVGENMVYFYTPGEAVAKAAELKDETIKVGGLVKPGSVDWKADQLSLKFTMTDNQGHEFLVRHSGTPPDMFKENQGVVAEGRFEESSGGKDFVSRRLMVKHSEEYKKPDDHGTMNKALLEESLFKGQKEGGKTPQEAPAQQPGGAQPQPAEGAQP